MEIAGDIQKAFNKCVFAYETEMPFFSIGSAEKTRNKSEHCDSQEFCLAWGRPPFFLELYSITLTSTRITVLMPYKGSKMGSIWMIY